jgi:hypothetical protein
MSESFDSIKLDATEPVSVLNEVEAVFELSPENEIGDNFSSDSASSMAE